MNLFYNKEQEEEIFNKISKDIDIQRDTILVNEVFYNGFIDRDMKNESDVRRIMSGRGIKEYIREELEQPLAYILVNQPFLYGLSTEKPSGIYHPHDDDRNYINTVTIHPTDNSFSKGNTYVHDPKHVYTMYRSNVWNHDEYTEESNITFADIKLNKEWVPACWTRGCYNNIYTDFNAEGRNGLLMRNTIQQRLEYAYNNIDKLLVEHAYMKIKNVVSFYGLLDDDMDSEDGLNDIQYGIVSGWEFHCSKFDDQKLLQRMSQRYVDSVLRL